MIHEFTVDHAVVDGEAHHMVLTSNGVGRWSTGRSAEPDLTLKRSKVLDTQDLRNIGNASAISEGTQLQFDARYGWCDLLGMTDGFLVREPPTIRAFSAGLQLRLLQAPFGDCDLAFSATREGLARGIEADVPKLTLELTYGQAVEWFHGSTTLRQLMRDARLVHGSVASLGTLEGLIKARGPRLSASTRLTLNTYARLRDAHRSLIPGLPARRGLADTVFAAEPVH
jgi:hypothetical protein